MAGRKRAASDEEGLTAAEKRAITIAQKRVQEQADAEKLIAAGRGSRTAKEKAKQQAAWLADKRPSKSAPKAPNAGSSKPSTRRKQVPEDDHNDNQHEGEVEDEANLQLSNRKSKSKSTRPPQTKQISAKRQRAEETDSEYEEHPKPKKAGRMSNVTPRGAEVAQDVVKVGPPQGSTRSRPILPRSLEDDNEPPATRPSQLSAGPSHAVRYTKARSTSKSAKKTRPSPFPSPPPRRVTRTYSSRKKKKKEAPLPIPGVDYLLSSSPLPPDDVGEAMRDLLNEAFQIGSARFDDEFPLVSQGNTPAPGPSRSVQRPATASKTDASVRSKPKPSIVTTKSKSKARPQSQPKSTSKAKSKGAQDPNDTSSDDQDRFFVDIDSERGGSRGDDDDEDDETSDDSEMGGDIFAQERVRYSSYPILDEPPKVLGQSKVSKPAARNQEPSPAPHPEPQRPSKSTKAKTTVKKKHRDAPPPSNNKQAAQTRADHPQRTKSHQATSPDKCFTKEPY